MASDSVAIPPCVGTHRASAPSRWTGAGLTLGVKAARGGAVAPARFVRAKPVRIAGLVGRSTLTVALSGGAPVRTGTGRPAGMRTGLELDPKPNRDLVSDRHGIPTAGLRADTEIGSSDDEFAFEGEPVCAIEGELALNGLLDAV